MATLKYRNPTTGQFEELVVEGSPGPAGPPGPPGPPGTGTGGGTYTHHQMTSASLWTIVHNLGFFPNIHVVNNSGEQVEGDVVYVNENTVTLSFSAPFPGSAYLS